MLQLKPHHNLSERRVKLPLLRTQLVSILVLIPIPHNKPSYERTPSSQIALSVLQLTPQSRRDGSTQSVAVIYEEYVVNA